MSLSADAIARNIRSVRERIRTAATAVGRETADIRLVAVSKKMSAECIAAAIAAGQQSFGENTLQDAETKQALIDEPGTDWHFIGHLQSNKAKAVAANFDWLHTLDNLKLAKRLSDNRPDPARPLRVLLQVNIARDPDKFGLMPDAVYGMTEDLLQAGHPGIRLCGLMTIGQRRATLSERRAEFSALRGLAANCADRFGTRYFNELSMGMSDDFEAAIEEGATMIRVGSAIFGPRPPAAARPE
jgi:pyridoxal phosphate enzyme (YggS family)